VSRVVGLVLAAGLSRRLGHPKQLLVLEDKPLVAHVVDRALASRLEEVVVVTGAHAPGIEEALAGKSVTFVHNSRFEAGMGTSMVAGVSALGADVDAAVIMLADQPGIATAAIDRLVEARMVTHAPVAMARYGDRPGHPVLFGREVFPELLQLKGDNGGREVVGAHRAEVVYVDGGAPEPLADVDTEEAWERLQEMWAGSPVAPDSSS